MYIVYCIDCVRLLDCFYSSFNYLLTCMEQCRLLQCSLLQCIWSRNFSYWKANEGYFGNVLRQSAFDKSVWVLSNVDGKPSACLIMKPSCSPAPSIIIIVICNRCHWSCLGILRDLRWDLFLPNAIMLINSCFGDLCPPDPPCLPTGPARPDPSSACWRCQSIDRNVVWRDGSFVFLEGDCWKRRELGCFSRG